MSHYQGKITCMLMSGLKTKTDCGKVESQMNAIVAYLDTCDHVSSHKLLKNLLCLVGWLAQKIQQQLYVKHVKTELCMLPPLHQAQGRQRFRSSAKPARDEFSAVYSSFNEQQCDNTHTASLALTAFEQTH